jgi:hypothetical protein
MRTPTIAALAALTLFAACSTEKEGASTTAASDTTSASTENYGTFTTAMYNLGEFPVPFADEPWFYGPPPSTDGDPTPLIYAWDPASKTFQVDNA